MTQKFFAGDLVYVKDNQQAIVLHSYAEHYDSTRRNTSEFGLYLIKDDRTQSWFSESQLTLIEANRFDLLPATNIIRLNHEAKMNRTIGKQND